MTWTHSFWLNVLIAVTIVGGAEEVLRRLIGKPIARVWIKVERFLDTWNGEPARDGLAARPGLVDRVIAIEYQVHNNGGGSMKDTVDRLAITVDRIESASEVAALKATKAAEMATESASMATATKASLDAHVDYANTAAEQGAKDKAEILARQDAQDHTISTLADAVKLAAQSTPPKHEETP